MIGSLRGKIAHVNLNRIIVDVQGVGYEVTVSLNSLSQIHLSNEISLFIYTCVRENSIELFGFTSVEERSMFELLIGVSGIGPKSGLAILSGLAVDDFREAVLANDIGRLTAAPGVGKKTGERIVLELRDKIRRSSPVGRENKSTTGHASILDDVVSSLISLGFKERNAEAAAKKALQKSGSECDLAAAIKLSLKELSS